MKNGLVRNIVITMFLCIAATLKAEITDANWASMNPGVPGVYGKVYAVATGSDGNIYVGGIFSVAGDGLASNIAKFNPETGKWSALGEGMNKGVFALEFDSDGNLYAGGSFTTAGGVTCNNIAKWNGTEWSTLGTGMGNEFSSIYSLTSDCNGNLYAGGSFTTAGGVPCKNIAKWNGTEWSTLGTGIPGEYFFISTLAFDGNGNLYAGGNFTTAGGIPCSNIARWNGTEWSNLGTGVGNEYSSIHSLTLDNDGNLYASGDFSTAGGMPCSNIARWNGTEWSNLGIGMDSVVFSLATAADGYLYAGGSFTTAGGVTCKNIAKWNGTEWSNLGTGMNGEVRSLICIGDYMYAGGLDFNTAGGVPCSSIAKWNGTEWSALGGLEKGMNGEVSAFAFDNDGNLYAGGNFTTTGGVTCNNVAKWNGTEWSNLGIGMPGGEYFGVLSLASDSSGNLYAGGDFISAGGVTCNNIAKWNGTGWSALGKGMDGTISALAFDNSGNLYAGGYFANAGGVICNNIAKWDGTEWNTLGKGMNKEVYTLAFDSNGNLYAGGNFTTADGVTCNGIAKWNGIKWSNLGSGMNKGVYALAFDSNWNLYAGGSFSTAGGVPCNYIARWNGTEWSNLGEGMDSFVFNLAFDKSENLYASGNFTTAGGGTCNGIAKWNGTKWSALGSGTRQSGYGASVYALAFDNDLNLYVGGYFSTAGDKVSPYIAKCLIGTPPTTCEVRFIASSGGRIEGQTLQTVANNGNCSEVTAVPSAGYLFKNWAKGPDVYSTDAAITVTKVIANASYTANFQPAEPLEKYAVSFVAGPGGSLNPKSQTQQSIDYGKNSKPVKAIPGNGMIFVSWTLDDGTIFSVANPTTVKKVKSQMTLTANFAVIPQNVMAASFYSKHTDTVKNSEIISKDNFGMGAKLQVSDWANFTAQTPISITMDDWVFSRTLGQDPGAKITVNGGSAKFTEPDAKGKLLVVTVKWDKKGILNISVKATPAVGSNENVINLNGAPDGNIAGTVTCRIAVASEIFDFTVPYGGKKSLKQGKSSVGTVSWNVKGALKHLNGGQ